MNQDTINIAVQQIFSESGVPLLGVIGLLLIFATPIVFGGITAYISHKETHKVTMEVWKYWQDKNK